MRSDAIDELVGRYLRRPVRVSWGGEALDPLRGVLHDADVQLAGLATEWIRLEGVRLRADRVRLVPGLPAKLDVQGANVELQVGQGELDRRLSRLELPFRVRLGDKGVTASFRVAGIDWTELDTRLEVIGGWFVLRPRRARVLGIPAYVLPLLRMYLPIPPMSPHARFAGVRHAEGELGLRFDFEDFVESLTPDIGARLQRKLVPWIR